jgi:small-conductance mechanosensitive channel
VGIDLTALSVFGGALGVGLGFGMQKIAANYVSGFILLLDRSIRMGNLISVGNERGIVSQITTRYTVLKGMTGIESIVPNETLVGSVVQNETFTDPKVRVALPIQVSYATDLEKAMAIMVEAAQAQPRVMRTRRPGAFLEPLPTAASTCSSASGSATRPKAPSASARRSTWRSGGASRRRASRSPSPARGAGPQPGVGADRSTGRRCPQPQ